MAVAGKCQTRNELEQVLGKPKYVLKGDGFSIGSFVPDRVESYQKRGCVIELWFKGERFHSDSGFVPYTAWAEHEFDHVFTGIYDGDPKPNPDEVEKWKWSAPTEIDRDLKQDPDRYTPWFPIAFGKLMQHRKHK